MLQTRLESLPCSKVGWVSSHQKSARSVARFCHQAACRFSIVPEAAQSAPLPPPSGWSGPSWDSSHRISWISLDDLRSLKARATFVGHSAAAEESAAAVSMSASTDHFHASERSVAQARAQNRLRSHRCRDGRPRRAIAAPRRKTSRWTSPEAGSRCRRVAAVDGNTLPTRATTCCSRTSTASREGRNDRCRRPHRRRYRCGRHGRDCCPPAHGCDLLLHLSPMGSEGPGAAGHRRAALRAGRGHDDQ